MPIEAGQQLLHYRLIEKIGEGGMGVVWRATDTELDRQAAIKVLPPGSTTDAERLARFEREAKLLATLNHPNIAAVHGLHTHADVRFLAMEYVEGEDLATRLARGPLPVDEALEIAKQIADGLELAHRNDVIHRDLKPANVRLTAEGTVKILDFGLAKALGTDPSAAASDSTQSSTVTSFGTVAGVILGTASYMSPEQARGRAVDRRADIWAFGCVLYEMLTGRRPFGGETVTDTLAAVVRAEPNWDALPTGVPARVRQLLRRCLQKDPQSRLRDVGDAGLELLDAQAGVPLEPAATAATVRSPARAWLPWTLLAALAIALVASLMQTDTGDPTSRGKRQLQLEVAGGMRDFAPAISRDGLLLATVVIPSDLDEIPELHVQRLDTGEVRRLDTGGWTPYHLFFSPDGEWVGFTSWGKLMKARVDGGPPVEITEVFIIKSPPAWGDDDTIVFGRWAAGLSRVPAAGGEVQVLTRLDPDRGDTAASGISNHGQPAWTLDGTAVLFPTATGIDRVDVTTGEREQLLPARPWSIGVASGRLLWIESDRWGRPGALFAVEIEDDGRIAESSPTLIAEDVAAFAVSQEGTLVLAPTLHPPLLPVWVDREGNQTEIPHAPFAPLGLFAWPSISPDGTRISGHTADQIHVYDIEREMMTSLKPDPDLESGAHWLPDGRHIYFTMFKDGTTGVYRMAADGSDEAVALPNGEGHFMFGLSSDGKTIGLGRILDTEHYSERFEPRILVEGSEPLDLPVVLDGRTSLSSDGRRIAYSVGRRDEGDIHVMDIESGSRWKIGKGRVPRWSPKGDELFFRRGQSLMTVLVTATGPGRVETVFSIPSWVVLDALYAPHPDGERFFMQRRAPAETVDNRLTVLLDWMEPSSR